MGIGDWGLTVSKKKKLNGAYKCEISPKIIYEN